MSTNSPPSALETLLAYQNVGDQVHVNQGTDGHNVEVDATDSALMDYVVGNYDPSLVHHETESNDMTIAQDLESSSNNHTLPSQQPHHDPTTSTSTSTPVDTSHVHPTLLRLGASVFSHRSPSLTLPPPFSISTFDTSVNNSDVTASGGVSWDGERGEMGGKRRKPPHERAGWKEMDEKNGKRSKSENPSSQNHPTVGNDDQLQQEQHNNNHNVSQSLNDAPSFVIPGVGSEGITSAVSVDKNNLRGQENTAAEALMGFDSNFDSSLAAVGALSASSTAESSGGAGKSRVKMSKDARAEQNRKAQQIFRRKREEKIKQLEMDAAATVATRNALWELEQRAQQILFELQAKEVEIAAMRTSMILISQANAIPILSEDGSVVLDLAQYKHEDGSGHILGATRSEDAYLAFERLTQHAKDVVKAENLKKEQHEQADVGTSQ